MSEYEGSCFLVKFNISLTMKYFICISSHAQLTVLEGSSPKFKRLLYA